MKIDFEADRKILQAALEKWGFELQAIIAIEEMAELTKEISKHLRGSTPVSIDPMADEIADVQIMLWQLAEIVTREKVQERIEYKLQRLASRINES